MSYAQRIIIANPKCSTINDPWLSNPNRLTVFHSTLHHALHPASYTQGSIIANFDIHVQAIGLSDRSDHPVEPFYKHLAPVEVVEVTEEWVKGELGAGTAPDTKVAWPARHFFSGLPEAGDRLIMSVELRKGSSQ